jgi:hypothetical protein
MVDCTDAGVAISGNEVVREVLAGFSLLYQNDKNNDIDAGQLSQPEAPL